MALQHHRHTPTPIGRASQSLDAQALKPTFPCPASTSTFAYLPQTRPLTPKLTFNLGLNPDTIFKLMPCPIDPATVISSLQNPRIKAVVKLREHKHRRQTGLFIAEGQREITRASQAGLTATELYVVPELCPNPPALAGINATSVSLPVLTKMAYHSKPEGILAVFHQPTYTSDDLPPTSEQALVLVAVGTEKPGNLGAMARTAQAAGCSCLIAAGAPVDAMNPNAIRASTGAVFDLKILTGDEDFWLHELQQKGYRLLAATPHQAADYDQASYAGPTALIIGPEDTGLSQAWLDASDQKIRIPMQPGGSVDSLNASVSAGILLFEAKRQRSSQAQSD